MTAQIAAPRIPDGARGHVAHYLGAVESTEHELRNALTLVAERHANNDDLAHGAKTLALWSADHLRWIEPLSRTYGSAPYAHAARLRSALLEAPPDGAIGELADVADLATLVEHAELLWTILVQGAKELHEEGLLDVASRARDHSRRQLAWIRTIIEHEAPDAIATVPEDG